MNRKMFPLIFGREGGADTGKLHSLVMQQAYEDCDSIRTLNQETADLKQTVINILFDLIGIESNDTTRNLLLSLKRDVFNDRDITRYSDILSDYNNLKKAVDLYLISLFKLVVKKKQFKTSLENHLQKSVDMIGECWKQHSLANGILFSSTVLYEEITKVLSEGFQINKNNKNLLITLTKYFTRSATKTTPFSSLNKVFVMMLNEERFTNVDFNRKESRIQISNLIFLRIKEILLGNKSFVRYLVIKSNSAIYKETDEDDCFHFFVNNRNNEYFKKAKRNPIVLEIIEQAKQGIHHQTLESLINSKYSQSAETANEFLNALIDAGILILQFPINIDNIEWVKVLIEFIEKNELTSDPDVLEIRQCLEFLGSTVLSLETMLDISKRWQYIDDCSRIISKVLNADGSCNYISQLVLSKNLFYENVFTIPDIKIESRCIMEMQDKIREVFFLFNHISIKKRSRNFLYKYMVNKGIKKMPLLQAYVDIFLENREVINSENIDFYHLDAMFDKLLPSLEEGCVDYPIDISTFIDRPSESVDTGIKFGVFVQFIDNKFDEIVINSFSGGYGSNVSRYLSFCPDIVLDRFREYIIDSQGDLIIADVRDASIHNSNSFPSLSSNTIDIASANTNSNKEIPLNALFLSVSGDSELIITNEDGLVVEPVNFSMEAIYRKSKFTQFLDLFNHTDLFGYSYFMQRVNNSLIKSALSLNFHMSPRIIFGKSIILKRKQWHISAEYLRSYIGVVEVGLDMVFIKLNAFLRDYSIPTEVFVKFSQMHKSAVGQPNDNYKPYYINFTAPLSVLVFMNMLNNSGNVIELSEVLPALPSNTESSPGRVREYVMSL